MTNEPPVEIALPMGRLRPWRLEDVPSVARHANNRNVSRDLVDRFPFPYAEEDARAWLAGVIGVSPVTNFAVEVDGEAAGSIEIRPLADVNRRTAGLGYWLAEPYWGRGIMTEAVRAMTGYGFERLDLLRIEAGVFARNAGSARVLEKAGFALEARRRSRVIKDGETLDELLYALVRGG